MKTFAGILGFMVFVILLFGFWFESQEKKTAKGSNLNPIQRACVQAQIGC